MKHLYRIILSLLFSAHGLFSFAQSAQIDTLISRSNRIRKQLPVEKLYLQMDKPAYLQNDTIWFKAYLLDGDYLVPSARSGLLYVELDDINNKSVKRIMVPLASGLSWGNITLDENVPEGSYTLRAYTNWIRNFGDDYVFKKSIYVASAGDQTRLVAASFKQSRQAVGKDNIRASILISGLDREPLRLRNMQLTVINGRRTLFKSNASTGVDGKLDVNFDLPENTGTKNLSIVAREVTKEAHDGNIAALVIPVTLNRPENTDLQFMPEGGTLLAGIPAKIGFKAIGEDGKGIEVSGKIVDSKQQDVSAFRSVHKGIGSFELMPNAGESYTAELILGDGSVKSYPILKVNSSGTGLRITDYKSDTLRVVVAVTPDLLAAGTATYYLVGQSRGVVCYGAQLMPKSVSSTVWIPKSLFPTGVARFTLLNAVKVPLNERILYIDHHDNLQMSVMADKMSYAPHDSIALTIQVTDRKGNPVRGSFSMAVTDDSQVKTDSTGSNIVNNLLLTGDLKGTVEEPGYYFENTNTETVTERDNLMLTQGWIGYDLKQVTNPEVKPLYAAEPEFTVQGTVTNAFNKPLAGSGVILLSKKPSTAMDAITGNNGRFVFRGLVPVDTAVFVIQALNKHGKTFNVGITVDEFKPPAFTHSTERIIPWYVNSDTLLLRRLNNQLVKQQAELKLNGAHVLKEVTIKAQKIIKGSKNLNGDGGADEVLDEKDMEKAGKQTLLQILKQKRISGFADENYVYKLHFDTLFLVIDGTNVDFFFKGNPMYRRQYDIDRHEFLKTYLDNLTAEDITGIEAIYNPSRYSKYDEKFYHDLRIKKGIINHSYIEVTTRSGNGAFMKATPGIYLYKSLAFSLPRQFYRPKYIQKNKETLLPDLRSTIHWEPNIITDTAGKATVSFYSADKPAGYTIILEGTDLAGRFGFMRRKLLVK